MSDRIRKIERQNLSELLTSPALRGGKMLIVKWQRLTDKKVNGQIIEPKGTFIERRVVLRPDWSKATPSGSFTPKGGRMFNASSDEVVKAARAKNDLYLFMSLEGVTHPHGEADHPVNVPLAHVAEIVDTRDQVFYRVV